MVETFRVRLYLSKEKARLLAEESLLAVNLEEVSRVFSSLPYNLSEGMLQRVAMAIMIGFSPPYILADEPTSALDEDNRTVLLNLLKTEFSNAGILFISHDVDALQQICSTVMVLEEGKISSMDSMEHILSQPTKSWTKKFSQAYHETEGFVALQNVHLHVNSKEYVALVGSSGSGKSTLARLLMGLESVTEGKIYVDEVEVTEISPKSWRRQRHKIQSVFQDSA